MDQKKIFVTVPAFVAALVVFFSLSATLVVGHIWRFPLAITSLVDARFVFSIFLPVGIELALAVIIFRLFSIFAKILCVRLPQEGMFFELSTILTWFFSILGVICATAVFSHRYFGLTWSEFEISLAFFLMIGFAFLFSSDLLLKQVKGIANNSEDLYTLLHNLSTDRLFYAAAIVSLFSAFLVGDLRLGNMLVDSEAQRRYDVTLPSGLTQQASDIVTVIGPTSQGVILASYSGSRIQNKKEIVMIHIYNGPLGSLQASRVSTNVPLDIAVQGVLWFAGLVDGEA